MEIDIAESLGIVIQTATKINSAGGPNAPQVSIASGVQICKLSPGVCASWTSTSLPQFLQWQSRGWDGTKVSVEVVSHTKSLPLDQRTVDQS